jgi:hypothetical protein
MRVSEMEKLEISRNGETDQFSIVLSQGNDTIRCMITVESGHVAGVVSEQSKYRLALVKAKILSKALTLALEHKSIVE